MDNELKLPKFNYTDDKKKEVISFRLSNVLIEKIEQIAEANGLSKNFVVTIALEHFVEQQKKLMRSKSRK